jgi:hypothetical protein
MSLKSPSVATKNYPEGGSIFSSETMVPIYEATRRHNEEEANINIHRHKNFKRFK